MEPLAQHPTWTAQAATFVDAFLIIFFFGVKASRPPGGGVRHHLSLQKWEEKSVCNQMSLPTASLDDSLNYGGKEGGETR